MMLMMKVPSTGTALFTCFEPTMKQRNIMNAKKLIILWLELGINDTRFSRCLRELNSSSDVLKRTDVVEDFLDKIAIGFYLFIYLQACSRDQEFHKSIPEHFQKHLPLPGTTDEWLWKCETHPTDTLTLTHTAHASKANLLSICILHIRHTCTKRCLTL